MVPVRGPAPRFVLVCVLSLVFAAGRVRADDAEVSAVEPRAGARAPLTLEEALALALAQSPELRAFEHGIRAEEARRGQATRRPNPEAAFEVENFGGSLDGAERAEWTLSLGQHFEMGGKRRARIAASEDRAGALRVDYEARRLVVAFEVAAAFIDALAAERRIALEEIALGTAAETDSVVGLRVRAGAGSRADKTRAEAELARARLELATAAREADAGRRRLAALWGAARPEFGPLAGDLDSLPPIPSEDSLLARVDETPDVARWDAEVRSRESEIQLERATGRTDLGVTGGYRHLAESGYHTFLAGVSIGLPFFDRNAGGVAAAGAAAEQARAERDRAAALRRAAIVQTRIALEGEAERIETLRAEVLPKAERAFQEVREGFEMGRFSYLDLLDARRAWIGARRELVASLAEFHKTRAELEHLVSGPLEPSSTKGAP